MGANEKERRGYLWTDQQLSSYLSFGLVWIKNKKGYAVVPANTAQSDLHHHLCQANIVILQGLLC